MEVVELKVQVDKSQLTALDKEINALKSKTIKISVDASGFNALNKSTLQSMRSVTQYVNAVSRAQAQENKLSLAREKTAQATQRRITSENRLAAQVEKTKTTQAQATAQAEKTAQAQARLQTQIERTRTAQAQYATQAEKTATAQAKAATQTEKVSKSTSLLGDSLGNVALKMAAWQVMGDLVATPIRALKEALSTMKDVDTELVNIQKVTGNTGTEMEALSERAFQMASEYGRTATEVTQAMTEFARAGYGDQLEQMAEMSTLLQNIGDVSAETANSMLLAVDAAWGLGGSEEKLMSIMDGLNEITNKNATDMDKLASGMTVAASVFAESGESVQTFASMVGTGTAVTQRSGSEIARGLRTIMMNIRQIRGETEDGELIDGESIANASKALKEFAGISTMENGELRLASDVLDELADKWDNLNTVQQSAIAEALAGKRQANILTSLMANWDMVEKQMKEYASGAGSALQENEIYMDSWEAKTKQLSSTWTEFISHLVETDTIKGAISGVTGFIELLDSGLGRTTVKIAAFVAAFAGISKAVSKIKGLKIVGNISKFASVFSTIAKGQGIVFALTKSFQMLNTTMLANPIFLAASVAAGGIWLISELNDLRVTAEDLEDQLKETNSEVDSLISERDALSEKVDSGQATHVERSRLDLINQQIDAKKELAKITAQQLLDEKYGLQVQQTDAHGRPVGDTRTGGLYGVREEIKEYQDLSKAIDEYTTQAADGEEATQAQREAFENMVSKQAELKESLLETATELTDLGAQAGGLSDSQQEALDSILSTVGGLNQEEEAANGAAAAIEAAQTNTGALAGAFNEAAGMIAGTTYALEQYKAALKGGEKDDNYKGYAEAFKSLNEEIKEGRTNSEKFWAAAELIFGDELLSSIDYSAEKVKGLAKEVKGLYSDGENGGAGFVKQIEKLADATGKIYADDGSLIGEIKKLSDGSYDLDIPNENLDKLAKKLHTTEDGVIAAMEAWQVFSDSFSLLDVDDILSGAEKIGAAAKIDERTIVNVDKLRDSLTEAGKSGKEVHDVIERLSSEDNVFMISAEMDTDDLVSELSEFEGAIEKIDGKEVTINVQKLRDAANDAGWAKDQIDALVGMLGTLDNVNFTGFLGQVSSVEDAISGVNQMSFVGPQTLLQGVGDEASDAKSKVDELGGTTATPTVTLDKSAFDAGMASVDAELKKQRSGSATFTLNVVRGGTGSVLTGTASAEGSDNHPGGVTLLGDEYSPGGAPRPELVITRGKAYLAGRDGPEFRNLPAGARVIPYRETKEILDRSAKDDEGFPAFAGGTIKFPGSSSGKKTSSSKKKNSSSSSTRSSSKSKSSEKDSRQEELEKQVDLLKSELDLMEAQGKPASELAKKMGEIQGALHTQADYMRSIGADQADINKLSKEWWDIREDMKQAYQEEMEETRDALQEEFDLIEHQNGPTEKRIDLLKKVQDSLHQEAEFLRSIGADQKEINELSNEWWEIHQDILSVQEDLWSELEDAVDQELERAAEARDLELDALDKELERLDAEREAKEEKLELEEKTLAVQEAQAALANAQNERTIRTYNAASGQWEWVADADAVKDAEEALEDAQEDLEDYKEDLEYQAAVDAIEARREAIEKAYENLEEGWEDIIDSVQEPTRSIAEILADLAQNGTPLMKQQVDNVGKLLGDLNNYIRGAIGSETGESYYGGGGTPSMDFSHDTTDYHALMERASDEAEFNHWAKLREEKMKAQGIDPEASGLKTNAQIYEEWKNKNKGGSSGGGGSSSGGSSSGGGKVVGSVNGKAPPGLSTGDKVVTQGGTYEITGVNKDGSYTSNKVSDQTKSDYESSGGKYDKYDSGGVLRGLGGIKATEEDEMILPPDITAAMLTPAADATFQARLAELGVLYGAKRGPLTLPAGMSQNRDSHDHHGDSYTFGDVTLTEEQARGMTVYDLAQKSRSLGLYGWRH